MDAFQRSPLQAFIQSPLQARGNITSGLILYLATDFSTSTGSSFQYGLRLVQAADKSRSADVITMPEIEEPYNHPPALPKDFPSFRGGALVEFFYYDPAHSDDITVVSSENVDFSDQDIYYGTEVVDREYEYPDWTVFKDPAGDSASNPSYDKAANDAKPSSMTIGIRATLLNKDGNPVKVRDISGHDGTGYVMTSATASLANKSHSPSTQTWTRASETVTISGSAGLSIFSQMDSSGNAIIGVVNADVTIGGISTNITVRNTILVQSLDDVHWNTQTGPSIGPGTWNDTVFPNGVVTSLSYSMYTSLGKSRASSGFSVSSINPSPDQAYFSGLFSGVALPVNTYTTVSETLPGDPGAVTPNTWASVQGWAGSDPTSDFHNISLPNMVADSYIPNAGTAVYQQFNQGWFNGSFNVDWEDYDGLRDKMDTWIETAISNFQPAVDSNQQSTYSPYDRTAGTSTGWNVLTVSYVGRVDT